MAKVVSRRTITLIVLGVLALITIDVRGVEEASDRGNVAGMMGHLAIPIILLLAMLVVICLPRAKAAQSKPEEKP